MVSYVINPRTECDKNKLRVYITRFFRSALFKTRYIYVQLIFYTQNEPIQIGDNYLLDIKNDSEIKTYKFYIFQYFEHDFLRSNDNKNINKIVFNYSASNRKEYLKQIKNLRDKYSYSE